VIQNPDDLLLSWPQPATDWSEAAPVGNGRLGAMVFGGAARARWQVNDATVWSGTPDGPREALSNVLADGAGPQRLAEVREAIRAEDYERARELLMSFEGPYSQEFLPFVDLWMTLDGSALAYRGRTLNLDNGIVSELIELDDRTIRRLTWSSSPADALCIALTVETGTVDLTLALGSPLRVVEHAASERGLSLGIELPVDGAPLHEPDVPEPLRYAPEGFVSASGYDPYAAVALAVDTDGRMSASEGALTINGASRVLITLASSTAAEDVWDGADPADRAKHQRRATAWARAALALGTERLLAEHEADLRTLLSGTRLTIGTRRAGTFDVADEVLSGKDEQLTATVMVQLGRYLLAAASRPGGGPPANLQGLWNQELRPAWSSNYTININTQMNYWGAEAAGLSECHEPLFRLIEKLADTGGEVAAQLYGARGWLAHHNSDPWGWALPVGMGHGNPSWAIWMMGGVWLAQHLWDHADFTGDTDFLRERAWPLLRGCAEFCLDWLVPAPDGMLDTIPSTSPENLFVSRGGTRESLSVSTAMDVALIRALLVRTLTTAHLLGSADEDPVCAEIRAALPRLRPTALTADGRLREWSEDHTEDDPHHRHMSPMIAVFPLGQIDPDTTPDLAEAAAGLLDARGPGAMGWSWSWKIALRARLRDAATARGLLLEAVRPFDGDPARHADPSGAERWGGLLPNLFSTHPPFQIDGNYGLMAAVLEIVVQSHGGAIRALPAVPEQWPDGSCRGVRCRGGLAVDLNWSRGALTALTVRRLAGPSDQPVSIRYGDLRRDLTVPVGAPVRLGPDLREL
jgi:alpha-L-fucosidase 2